MDSSGKEDKKDKEIKNEKQDYKNGIDYIRQKWKSFLYSSFQSSSSSTTAKTHSTNPTEKKEWDNVCLGISITNQEKEKCLGILIKKELLISAKQYGNGISSFFEISRNIIMQNEKQSLDKEETKSEEQKKGFLVEKYYKELISPNQFGKTIDFSYQWLWKLYQSSQRRFFDFLRSNNRNE